GNIECLVPLVHVADRAVGAELRRRVTIRSHLLTQRLVARDLAPDLAEAQEEALLTGEAVEHRRLLALERDPIRLERDVESAQVTDVLAQRQPAIDEQARQRLELRVLIRQLAGQLLEATLVLFDPPLA